MSSPGKNNHIADGAEVRTRVPVTAKSKSTISVKFDSAISDQYVYITLHRLFMLIIADHFVELVKNSQIFWSTSEAITIPSPSD
jgi:hypothetical protein